MGGAVYYSINTAEGNHKKAGQFIAASCWLLIVSSIIFTLLTFFSTHTLLALLEADDLSEVKRMAYTFAIILAFIGCIIMFLSRSYIGVLFGSSDAVNTEIAKIIPIFLVDS